MPTLRELGRDHAGESPPAGSDTTVVEVAADLPQLVKNVGRQTLMPGRDAPASGCGQREDGVT